MNLSNVELDKIDAIIWFQTAFLGDMILSTGAFDLAKQKAPHIKQFLITTPLGKAALKDHQALTGTFAIRKKQFSFFAHAVKIRKSLKRLGLNSQNCLTIQLHRSTRSSIICKILGFRVISFAETSLSALASLKVKRVAVFHESVRNALPLECLGISRNDILNAHPSLSPQADSPSVKGLRQECFKIGIAPGSVWQTKMWPIDKFKALITKLLKHQKIQLIVLGSNKEAPLLKYIKQDTEADFNSGKILDLVGKTKLDDLRYIYPQLNLLISNDSSPIHYASAFHVPTIAIFGATVATMGFGPLAKGSIVIEKRELKCRPCSAHGPKKCPLKHFKCMQDIDVDEVYHKVLERIPQEYL